MDWLDEKALDLASQASTQLLTLGVAVLALIAAWRVTSEGTGVQKFILKASSLCYFVSLLAGTWFLLALTGTVASEEIPGTIYGVVQEKPREVLFEGHVVVFQPHPVPARLELPTGTSGGTVKAARLAKPTIWDDNTALPMTLQIYTFATGSILIALVFLTKTNRPRVKNNTASTA